MERGFISLCRVEALEKSPSYLLRAFLVDLSASLAAVHSCATGHRYIVIEHTALHIGRLNEFSAFLIAEAKGTARNDVQ